MKIFWNSKVITMKKINVLMTGAWAPNGPGIIRKIKKDKNISLTVCDADPHASGRFLNDKFEIIPQATDPKFITFILSLIRKNHLDIIFPLVTKGFFKFSENRALFENN